MLLWPLGGYGEAMKDRKRSTTASGRGLVLHQEGATRAAPLIVRQPSRPWGSVRRRHTGRGRTDSTAVLLEDRRRR